MTLLKPSCLFLVALAACNEPARCEEASRSIVTDPDAPLLVGGTYSDALAAIAGERSGVLQWHDGESHVVGFPAPGESRVTLLMHEPSTAWNVDLQRQGGQRNERLACPDRFEAEIEVEIRSDDGVLDMSVMALATFQTVDTAMIVLDVTGEDLGMLDWSPVEEGASLLLVLSLGPEGGEGALRLVGPGDEEVDSAGGVGQSVELVTWMMG